MLAVAVEVPLTSKNRQQAVALADNRLAQVAAAGSDVRPDDPLLDQYRLSAAFTAHPVEKTGAAIPLRTFCAAEDGEAAALFPFGDWDGVVESALTTAGNDLVG